MNKSKTILPPYMFLHKIWLVYIQSAIINALFIVSKILYANYDKLFSNEATPLLKFTFMKGGEVLFKWVIFILDDFNKYKIFLIPLVMSIISIYEICEIDSNFKAFLYSILIIGIMWLSNSMIL